MHGCVPVERVTWPYTSFSDSRSVSVSKPKVTEGVCIVTDTLIYYLLLSPHLCLTYLISHHGLHCSLFLLLMYGVGLHASRGGKAARPCIKCLTKGGVSAVLCCVVLCCVELVFYCTLSTSLFTCTRFLLSRYGLACVPKLSSRSYAYLLLLTVTRDFKSKWHGVPREGTRLDS